MIAKILIFYFIFFNLFNIVKVKSSWLFLLIGSLSFCLLIQSSSLIYFIIVITIIIIFERVNCSKKNISNKLIFLLTIDLLLFPLVLTKFISSRVIEPFFNIKILTLIPLGLSFYTFKAISYISDIRRGLLTTESHIGRLALYIMFFPQLASGPIDRAGNLLNQFKSTIVPKYREMVHGWRMILWGGVLKLVIADKLAVYVDQVYANPYNYKGLAHLTATYFYSFQIYCDFAGYSLIAIGMARALGIASMRNFNFPYMAENLIDFWRRWHISMSKWLRDYIFLPLAYLISRKIKRDSLISIQNETWAYVGGILVTMAVCGIWHGAKWTFVVWGLLHGTYLAISHLTKRIRKRAWKRLGITMSGSAQRFFKIFITFNLVSFAWIFFRAASLSDALFIIHQIFAGISFAGQQRFFAGITLEEFMISSIMILSLVAFEYLRRFEIIPVIEKWSCKLRWAAYYGSCLALLLFGVSKGKTFIYSGF